jgi:hypothetical protein
MKRTWDILQSISISEIVPMEDAKTLAAKGLITMADVLRDVIARERSDRTPIDELGLPTYVVRRLKARGIATIGGTDALSEERIRVYVSGLGTGAIRAINQARVAAGKPRLIKH